MARRSRGRHDLPRRGGLGPIGLVTRLLRTGLVKPGGEAGFHVVQAIATNRPTRVATTRLIIAADVLGLPHYRTGPGVYVGLEGEKTTDNTELPMIDLIRLGCSVFG
ncbi:MAG: hypothetical protein ACIAXF_01495 [Phycisphaerales bacterium JB063]